MGLQPPSRPKPRVRFEFRNRRLALTVSTTSPVLLADDTTLQRELILSVHRIVRAICECGAIPVRPACPSVHTKRGVNQEKGWESKPLPAMLVPMEPDELATAFPRGWLHRMSSRCLISGHPARQPIRVRVCRRARLEAHFQPGYGECCRTASR